MERGQPGGDMQMAGLLSTTGHVFIGLKQEQFRGVLALFPLINRCRRQSLNQRERRSCVRERCRPDAALFERVRRATVNS